ncbi:MAG: hypothetical protein M3R69_15315 [Acidobacteriota bacterium]|nr:hypothetical protein [Acidobacteriota bacterium]
MKLFVLAAVMLCSLTAATTQNEPLILMTTREEGPPEPRLEAIALIDHGQFKAPGGLKNREAASFVTKYLPNGRKFFVVFGGGAAGTINLTESGLGCNDLIYAIGPFSPGSLGVSRIHGQVKGLATNSDMIARSEIWRRAPAAAERAAAVDLAKAIFAGKGLTPAQLAKLETVNLTAIDVDGDNRAELVGTFKVPSDANRTPRYVFLIAEGEGGSYQTVFSSYRYLPKSDIYNSGEETLIDYLDLDRDGTAEIVTGYTGVRDQGYHIYRRVNGRPGTNGAGDVNSSWKIVYENATELCISEGGD